ncbi:MAG TPA: NADH-quinone oxidoreductase subunit L [Nitrospirota bacterium]|nr:NADH-quinone oxidoreductase subunit L [Nitrospirota bacterium]
MNTELFFIPFFPLAGFIMLALAGKRLPKRVVASIGAGSVGLSALLASATGIRFLLAPPQGQVLSLTLWDWMQVGGTTVSVSFLLDPLSLIMVLVITVVGFLIHLYATQFMEHDEGYSRFFAYMNLFVFAMLVLVLADNLVVLYLGWEGVGLCSYLLIGFWYADPANGRAARKAFIVTRVGDTAMAIGLFLLFSHLGTLNINELMIAAPARWPVGADTAVLAAALLLGGAVGKSAQLPLQVWLPDAMAGPTPVSALIHAATMVTAGVYLVARTHVLFELAPPVQAAVAVIGAATLLIAGLSALAQRDIKRVLAYSTISQIGYMFLALGVGAWSAAMFHFMTHAFFKALLFLGAGVVILAQHEEHDMFRMGGLRDKLPATFWTFLVGAASLSAVPLVTAGFYSKDLILWHAWSAPRGGAALWAAGLAGAFITSLYTFRMVFLTFFGESKTGISFKPGRAMTVPLMLLAGLSIIGGFVELPETLGNLPLFSRFLNPVLPAGPASSPEGVSEFFLQLDASFASLAGIGVAWVLYVLRPAFVVKLTAVPAVESARKFWLAGGDFDALYNRLFVRPFVRLAEMSKRDFIDSGYTGIADLSSAANHLLSRTQTGNIRWYAMGIALGAAVFLAIVVVLSP